MNRDFMPITLNKIDNQLQDIGAPPWSFPNDNLPEIKDMKLPDMRQGNEPVVEAQSASEDDESVDLETAVAWCPAFYFLSPL
ncbi:unnamed protein product, partial [Ceratitis capitata]